MEHADSIIARAGTRNVAGASAAGAAAVAAAAASGRAELVNRDLSWITLYTDPIPRSYPSYLIKRN